MIALAVGALEPRFAAVAAQCAACGAEKPNLEPSDQIFETMQTVFAGGDVGGTPETTVGPMPVVSFDQAGSPSLLKPIQAFRWFIDYGGRHGTLWENRVTRVNPPTPVPFSAYLAAPYIKVPSFIMAGRNDEMGPMQSGRDASDLRPHALPERMGRHRLRTLRTALLSE